MGTLTRQLSRLAEELTPYLSASHALYVLGAPSAAAPQCLAWTLADVQEMNAMGVDRMVGPRSRVQGVRDPSAWRG